MGLPRKSTGFTIEPFAHPLKVSITVHDNVVATILPDRGAAQTVIWYDAHGCTIASHTSR